MGRALKVPFSGFNAAPLGYKLPLELPPSFAASCVAGYVIAKSNPEGPLADLSGGGRDLINFGANLVDTEIPTLGNTGTPGYANLVTPFTGNDLNFSTAVTVIMVVKTAAVDYSALNGFFSNNEYDQRSALGGAADPMRLRLVLQADGSLFGSAVGTPGGTSLVISSSEAGAANVWRMVAIGVNSAALATGFTAYRKRNGQASLFTTTYLNGAFTGGPAKFGLGDLGVYGTVGQIAAAFFVQAQMTQAQLDTAYGEIATLLSPYGVTL